jgi:hydroxymethylbilane synthase
MKFRCGTRGSLLALAQTKLVIDALEKANKSLKIEQHQIKTLGDRKQGTPEASQSDKKDWIIDLEMALLNSEIDFAVHSSKDIPYEIEVGTALLPVLTRAKPFDAFVGRKISADGQRLKLADLPSGAKVGTASLRRRAYLLNLRPDIHVIEHRGNVPTRIQKMDDSDDIMGAIIASAGLARLDIPGLEYEIFSAEQMLPALNQGTLAVQFRAEDQLTKELLLNLVDPATQASWLAERRVAEILEGDCKSAIACFAQCEDDQVFLRATVMLPDGSESVTASERGTFAQAHDIGQTVGYRLLELGAKQIIDKSRRTAV